MFVMMPKLEPLDFSDGESVVDSIEDAIGSPASSLSDWCDVGTQDYMYESDDSYSPRNNFADALFMGSQVIDYNSNEYKSSIANYNMDYKSPPDSIPCSPLDSSAYFMSEAYVSPDSEAATVNMCWPNASSVQPNLLYQNLFQQQAAYQKHSSPNREEQRMKEVFQMSQELKKYNELQQQKVLCSLIKQQYQAYSEQKQNILPPQSPVSESSIPSPIVPPPDSVMNHQLNDMIKQETCDENDKLDFLDEEMLFKTFETLADFVNNEDVKSGASQITNKSNTAVQKPKRKRVRRPTGVTGTGKPRLYNFLKEILDDPVNYSCIEWVDKSIGLFKFLDSAEVARLWGYRKNKPAMKYENFARSLRTYIAKGILTKPRNKLVYCFSKPLPT